MLINLNEIKRNGILQHDSSDCGPACLASVINCSGGKASIENIRRLSGTDKSGTTMLGLYQAANKLGFDATGYEADIDGIMNYGGILIHHVQLNGNLEHYIVNFGYSDGRFVIWDPSEGLKLLSPAELEAMWTSKKCLGLVKNNNFISREESKAGIRQWLITIIKPDINLFIISIVAGIVFSVLGLVLAIFSQKLIDNILPGKDVKLLIISLILVFILLVARIIAGSLRQLMLFSQGRDFNIRIVDNFFGTLLFLPKSFFDTRKTGDFVARLNDTIRIQRVITEIAGAYIIDILIVLISIIVMFFYSCQVALFSIVFSPLFFILIYRWNNKILSGQREVMVKYAQSESFYINSLKGITEVKSAGWEGQFRSVNRRLYTEFQDKNFLLGKIKVSLGLITGIMGSFYIIAVILYSAIAVMNMEKTTGELMAIMSVSSGMIPSILNLALVAIPINEAKVAINRMFEFTQIEKEVSCGVQEKPKEAPEVISINNISFRFPGQRLLLDRICMDIAKGKITSLVGESGEGKSTLANILMRFYEPEAGDILINHRISAVRVSLQEWRSMIGYIPQEIHIFNGTILQNIIMDLSEEKVNELIKMINEYDFGAFFDSFPMGFMTLAGEDGINLSGGQKQVIGFFRVLVRHPRCLVIDEGTSGMDTETERKITKLIVRLKNSMGILMITHKVNLARKISDEIYVLEGGRITGRGDHDKLIAENEKYIKFWENFM